MTEPKILFYDIEWSPATALIWRAYDENVSPEQLLDPGGLLCFSAIKGDTGEVIFHSEWGDGHKRMVKKLHELLEWADAVVTYNGDRYDLPKTLGEFVLAGLLPPPPPTSIDLYKTVKKLGFIVNKLAFIGPFLKVGEKIRHEGFSLWRSVLEGDKAAQKRMEEYCIQDSELLVGLYEKLRPFIRNHPHLGEAGASECGACGSHNLQKRGFRRTKAFRIQRLQCSDCGSWQDGSRSKV